MPLDLQIEITNNQADIEQLQQRINERKDSISLLKQRFANDKQRYIALKSHNKLGEIATVALPEKTP
jgi:cell division protein FtsB